jgi:predicted acylesterase/phospholipase RssA
MGNAKRAGQQPHRFGLALAGGGPGGAVYEIGALRALDDAIEGLDFNDLHVYVGVSAGSFVASCLANGLTTAQMCRAIVKTHLGEHPFSPKYLFQPAALEFFNRGLMTPRLVLESLWDYIAAPEDLTLLESLTRVARALPVGVFNNDPLRAFLERSFSMEGRTDDFRYLKRHLIVVAADLDSGEAVRFGEPGFDAVPISRAVQASTALPGLYPPVIIDGRYYVDGVLLKTMHASVAIEAEADLVLCINPIVPVDTARAVDAGVMRRGTLVNRGLPTVLAQSLRTLVHSRLTTGVANYASTYPDRDVLLLEPRRDDYDMFFTNVFSFSKRKEICEHAYKATLEDLLERRAEIEPVLARHGVRLRVDFLEEEEPDLWRSVGTDPDKDRAPVTERLDRALSDLEALLRS